MALDDFNISWEDPWEPFDLIEPWEDEDEGDPRPAGGCAYCPETEVHELPEPFGGQPCCEGCFTVLIGGERDDLPWRCGTSLPSDGEGEQ